MKSSVAALLVLFAALTAGCRLLHWHRKAAELPPARSVEVEFRTRWIQKRVGELMSSGAAKTEAEAQETAAQEFAKQYPFVRPPAPPKQ